MPSQILTCPIVDAYYRPPARVVLSHLPIGTPLDLDPEPDNEHDPNAIAVHVSMQHVADMITAAVYARTTDALNEELMSCGSSCEELHDFPDGSDTPDGAPRLHLGYIPRTHNVAFLSALAASPSHRATLAALPDGKPAVRLSLEPAS